LGVAITVVPPALGLNFQAAVELPEALSHAADAGTARLQPCVAPMPRHVKSSGIAAKNKHGMRAASPGIDWVIERSVFHPTGGYFRQPFLCLQPELIDLAELYGFCGKGLGTCRIQAGFLTVITKSTLSRRAHVLITLDHAERTRDHAAVALGFSANRSRSGGP